MKKLLIPIILALALATPAFAVDKPIHAEWTKYTPPVGATVAGFNLYKEGTLACKFVGPLITSADCTTDITRLNTSFTLSALFSDGKESPQSTPFVLTDYGPPPTDLKVTIVVVRTVSTLNSKGKPVSTTTITRKTATPGQTIKEGTSSYRNTRGEWITNTTIAFNNN